MLSKVYRGFIGDSGIFLSLCLIYETKYQIKESRKLALNESSCASPWSQRFQVPAAIACICSFQDALHAPPTLPPRLIC